MYLLFLLQCSIHFSASMNLLLSLQIQRFFCFQSYVFSFFYLSSFFSSSMRLFPILLHLSTSMLLQIFILQCIFLVSSITRQLFHNFSSTFFNFSFYYSSISLHFSNPMFSSTFSFLPFVCLLLYPSIYFLPFMPQYNLFFVLQCIIRFIVFDINSSSLMYL